MLKYMTPGMHGARYVPIPNASPTVHPRGTLSVYSVLYISLGFSIVCILLLALLMYRRVMEHRRGGGRSGKGLSVACMLLDESGRLLVDAEGKVCMAELHAVPLM